MSWSLSEDLHQNVQLRLTRASEGAVRERDREVKEGAERLSARGVSGGQDVALRRNAAKEAVAFFGREAKSQTIGVFKSVYDDNIPVEALDWIEDLLNQRIKTFADGNYQWFQESARRFGVTGFERHGEEAIRRPAFEALRDLKIELGEIRGRATHRRKDQEAQPVRRETVIYNVTGPNSRVNVNSSDSSTNVVNIDVKQFFASMQKALDESSIESGEQNALRVAIDEMEAANGSTSFGKKYAAFIQLAANHLAIFQPFIPALSQLLLS